VLVPQTDHNPGVLRVGLVASDDALRSSVRLLLAVSGMDVQQYRTAQEFLASGPDSYSCLVIDCQLADMSGHELCIEAIRQNARIPIVLLAASPEAFHLTDTTLANVRVVSKPFAGDVLTDAIEESAGAGSDDSGESGTPPQVYPAVC